MGLTIFTLACVMLGNGIDYATTRVALRLGAFEQNPLVRRALTPVKIIGSLLQVTALLAADTPTAQALVGVGILIFYSAVGAWNVHQTVRIVRATQNS